MSWTDFVICAIKRYVFWIKYLYLLCDCLRSKYIPDFIFSKRSQPNNINNVNKVLFRSKLALPRTSNQDTSRKIFLIKGELFSLHLSISNSIPDFDFIDLDVGTAHYNLAPNVKA